MLAAVRQPAYSTRGFGWGILTVYGILFSCRCSSVVELSPCKRVAVGSSPTIGSILGFYPLLSIAFVLRLYGVAIGTEYVTLCNLAFKRL